MPQKPINPFAWETRTVHEIMEDISIYFGKIGYALVERVVGGVTMMCLHKIQDDGKLNPVLWIKEIVPMHPAIAQARRVDLKDSGSLEYRSLNSAAAPTPPPLAPGSVRLVS